jgi:hypothetical protein
VVSAAANPQPQIDLQHTKSKLSTLTLQVERSSNVGNLRWTQLPIILVDRFCWLAVS